MKPARSASTQPSCVAWDTSGHALVIAAAHRGRKTESRSSGLAYHSEKLFVTLEARGRALAMDLSKLDFVAVGRGPGSFTGIRVGVTAAKTLCYASGAKLIMISSLEIIAANLREEKRRVCVVQDARRNRLFTAAYENGVCIQEPQLVHTGDFLFRLQSGTVYTGDAVMMFADTLSRKYGRGAVIRDRRLWSPQPGPLLTLALAHWKQRRFSDPLKAVPEYLYEDTCNVTQPKSPKR